MMSWYVLQIYTTLQTLYNYLDQEQYTSVDQLQLTCVLQ
jgi:hypothetical protein